MWWARAISVPIVCLFVGLSGCAGGGPVAGGPTIEGPAAPLTVVPGTDAVSLAAATSAAFFRSAPPGGPAPVALPADPGAATALLDRYRAGPATPPPAGTLVLAHAAPEQLAATTTARDAGAQVVALPWPDPRSGADTQRLLTTPRPAHVVALGRGFGPLPVLERRLATAVSAAQLPGGGQLMFPGRLVVALYGAPGTPALGTLGEQGISESVTRARQLAVDYRPFSAAPVVPAFEIIATVAASSPGADGNYSGETDPAALRPWVDAAAAAGVYVVLDLQPGRTDFLTQAKLYADLLARPNVGLALDPEWRLAPGQVHRVQIGSVGAAEINSVVTWLADLTRARGLPQKLLMLHQFRVATIADRARVDTGRDEVAVLVHADGFGTPPLKLATWNALRAAPLPGAYWGWKDFIDEDHPTFTPRQTLQVSPDIRFVSYQ